MTIARSRCSFRLQSYFDVIILKFTNTCERKLTPRLCRSLRCSVTAEAFAEKLPNIQSLSSNPRGLGSAREFN